MSVIRRTKFSIKQFILCSGALLLLAFLPFSLHAAVTGECSNCHTMHNSQDGQPMADFNGETGPNEALTRGSCVGCHAQGPGKIALSGTSQIPQVYHGDATGDLAAGNFGYIDGTQGSGAADSKGHNVIDLFGVNSDGALDAPPGWHSSTGLTDSTLTCAGHYGCHGTRVINGESGIPALKGAHHKNEDGQLAVASETYNSYRFLRGVKGYESQPVSASDRWQNLSPTVHNEYYGTTSPTTGNFQSCANCHPNISDVVAPQGTISGFCGTCHGQFHFIGVAGAPNTLAQGQGIGGDIVSPFIRHPTDILINTKGAGSEYANYNLDKSYNINAPVGRTAVPASASGVVVPESDVVTCLSCHMAHASDYPDMLRWDYTTIVAGGGQNNTGCFICHTTKDD